jgi:small subunit ribosomal protein S14
MTHSDHKKAFTQLKAKPIVKAKYIKHNQPKARSCGKAKVKCQVTGRTSAVIRKYNLNLSRQTFRELAPKLGFKKYN